MTDELNIKERRIAQILHQLVNEERIGVEYGADWERLMKFSDIALAKMQGKAVDEESYKNLKRMYADKIAYELGLDELPHQKVIGSLDRLLDRSEKSDARLFHQSYSKEFPSNYNVAQSADNAISGKNAKSLLSRRENIIKRILDESGALTTRTALKGAGRMTGLGLMGVLAGYGAALAQPDPTDAALVPFLMSDYVMKSKDPVATLFRDTLPNKPFIGTLAFKYAIEELLGIKKSRNPKSYRRAENLPLTSQEEYLRYVGAGGGMQR